MLFLTAFLAVLAAFSNATASVLQRKAARREPPTRVGIRMLWDLAHQPVWVAGVTAILIGFALQIAALATGPITLVQPILIIELSFTLLLSRVVLHADLDSREWTAIAGMSGGVVLLLVALRPIGGSTRAVSGAAWALGSALTLGVVLTLLVLAFRRRGDERAALLGVSCGLYFGFIAVLVAGMTGQISAGIGSVFAAWQTYAIVVAGPSGFFLLQVTLRAGRLVASQPGLTLSNPIVGIGWGVAVFGDQVRGGGWIAAEVIGAALVAASTLLLARSPALHANGGGQG